jgi:hypothetical protein
MYSVLEFSLGYSEAALIYVSEKLWEYVLYTIQHSNGLHSVQGIETI